MRTAAQSAHAASPATEVDLQGRLSNPLPPFVRVPALLPALMARACCPPIRHPGLQVQRRLDPSDVATLIARRTAGASIEVLAMEFRVHRTTVIAHLRRLRSSCSDDRDLRDTLISVLSQRSAFKHGVAIDRIRHAYDHVIVVADLDPHSDPPKVLLIGPDAAGNLLELIALVLVGDELLIIHAMPLRQQFYPLLPDPTE